MTTKNWVWTLIIIVFGTTIPTGHLFARKIGTLNGTVVDPTGMAIPNALVILYWNNAGDKMSWNGVPKLANPGKKGLTVITDSRGQFSVKVTPGWWDVFVHEDGFLPICRNIGVEDGKTQNIELHFVEEVAKVLE